MRQQLAKSCASIGDERDESIQTNSICQKVYCAKVVATCVCLRCIHRQFEWFSVFKHFKQCTGPHTYSCLTKVSSTSDVGIRNNKAHKHMLMTGDCRSTTVETCNNGCIHVYKTRMNQKSWCISSKRVITFER